MEIKTTIYYTPGFQDLHASLYKTKNQNMNVVVSIYIDIKTTISYTTGIVYTRLKS
ncbi:hypothetical protein Hanom_Chr14g01276901 [Helianthus anomalus]